MATYREVIEQQLANGEYRLPPLYEALGMRLTRIADDAAEVTMPVDAQLYNQRGTLQGGFVATPPSPTRRLTWPGRACWTSSSTTPRWN